MSTGLQQDRGQEVAFFDRHAEESQEYNVFTAATNQRLIQACIDRTGIRTGERILDVGCGSGIFSHWLAERGLKVSALDISPKLIALGRARYPNVEFQVGDAEHLPYESGAFDAVSLFGVIHHFPDPAQLAREVARVTKPGGSFFAFDPNRRNPFMYLYRVKSSPCYSPVGVTPNEQPVRAEDVVPRFQDAGFAVHTDYTSVKYTYVASRAARLLLPLYNLAEVILFAPRFMRGCRAFLLTWGRKPLALRRGT
jgi:ubiquinone/menaquinone biosynthesis C-methylase UbiE